VVGNELVALPRRVRKAWREVKQPHAAHRTSGFAAACGRVRAPALADPRDERRAMCVVSYGSGHPPACGEQ
jgi:hypothetical protein